MRDRVCTSRGAIGYDDVCNSLCVQSWAPGTISTLIRLALDWF